MTNIVSIIAVIGAWIGGLGIIFAVTCFCFGILRPSLLRWGLNYLLVTDVGLIVMLAALLYLLNDLTLQVFAGLGILVLIGFTVAAFVIVRVAARGLPAPTNVIETTRRRIEF